MLSLYIPMDNETKTIWWIFSEIGLCQLLKHRHADRTSIVHVNACYTRCKQRRSECIPRTRVPKSETSIYYTRQNKIKFVQNNLQSIKSTNRCQNISKNFNLLYFELSVLYFHWKVCIMWTIFIAIIDLLINWKCKQVP